MRMRFPVLWSLLPLPLLALHFGAGQRWLACDRAARGAQAARDAAEAGDWLEAERRASAAVEALGSAAPDARVRLLMDVAQAQLERGEADGAINRLRDTLADPALAVATEATRREVRERLAEASLLSAWVMRLEGASRDEWLPDAEQARQQYRLLAEQVGDAADGGRLAANLERVVRFERATLEELRARPLPRKCNGMCGKRLASKRRGSCSSNNNGNGKPGKPGPDDSRSRQPAQGAGLAAREAGVGS